MRLEIKVKPSYDVYIEQDFKSLLPFLQPELKVFLICDEHIALHYREQCAQWFQVKFEILVVPAGEQYKTRETKAKLEDELCTLGCGRDSLLIAVGGGVILDLVGFLAATFCRGVPVIYMPTSLLAMVDASIGGKTAVNTPFGKNLIGAFSNPLAVLIHIGFLNTLPKIEFINGMAEVIKHALIADYSFLAWLMQHQQQILALDPNALEAMIIKSTQIKQQVVEADSHEKHQRQILNFGHTIAHAIEKQSHYECRHGEAVAIGMVYEAYIAHLMGKLSLEDVMTIKTILEAFDLPTTTTYLSDFDKLLYDLNFDKKNKQHHIYMVVLNQLGGVYSELQHYSFPIHHEHLLQAHAWMTQPC